MIKRAIILIFCFKIIGIIMTSCCKETYIVERIKFSAAYFDNQNKEDKFKYYSPVDTLKDKIVFMIQRDSLKYVSIFKDNFNSCYATSCAVEYKNELIESSFKLYSDKSIIVDNNTITERTNWWNDPAIKKYMKFYENVNDDFIIEFDNSFITNSKIPDGNYKFYFECKTSDNKQFNDSTSIVIKLK